MPRSRGARGGTRCPNDGQSPGSPRDARPRSSSACCGARTSTRSRASSASNPTARLSHAGRGVRRVHREACGMISTSSCPRNWVRRSWFYRHSPRRRGPCIARLRMAAFRNGRFARSWFARTWLLRAAADSHICVAGAIRVGSKPLDRSVRLGFLPRFRTGDLDAERHVLWPSSVGGRSALPIWCHSHGLLRLDACCTGSRRCYHAPVFSRGGASEHVAAASHWSRPKRVHSRDSFGAPSPHVDRATWRLVMIKRA